MNCSAVFDIMNAEEKVSYLKILMLIALADDVVEESELTYFSQVGELFELSLDELNEIQSVVLEKK